jgi:hypothetical protein
MAAIDRVVHHSVILDMMEVKSFRAKEATHQHLRESAEDSEQPAEMVVAGGTK